MVCGARGARGAICSAGAAAGGVALGAVAICRRVLRRRHDEVLPLHQVRALEPRADQPVVDAGALERTRHAWLATIIGCPIVDEVRQTRQSDQSSQCDLVKGEQVLERQFSLEQRRVALGADEFEPTKATRAHTLHECFGSIIGA